MRQTIALVGGPPRSGTTALARLLSSHPDVAITHERYGRRVGGPEFGEQHFEAARVRSYDPKDGAREAFEIDTTQDALRRWDSVKVVGDKVPSVSRLLLSASRIAGSRVIVVLREPYGMAQSFQRRFAKAQDPWNLNFQHSIRIFNEDVRALSEADPERDGYKLMAVEYHNLFTNPDVPGALFDFLGVDATKTEGAHAVQRQFGMMRRKASQVARYVAHHAAFGEYRRLVRSDSFLRSRPAL